MTAQEDAKRDGSQRRRIPLPSNHPDNQTPTSKPPKQDNQTKIVIGVIVVVVVALILWGSGLSRALSPTPTPTPTIDPRLLEARVVGKVGDCNLSIPTDYFAEITVAELEAVVRYDGCSEDRVKLWTDNFDQHQSEARQHLAEVALTETAWASWTVEELSRCSEISDTARRWECEEKLQVEYQLSTLNLLQLPHDQATEWQNHERRLERAAEIVEASTQFPTQATCDRLNQAFEDVKGALAFIRGLDAPDTYLGIEAYLTQLVRLSEQITLSCLSITRR